MSGTRNSYTVVSGDIILRDWDGYPLGDPGSPIARLAAASLTEAYVAEFIRRHSRWVIITESPKDILARVRSGQPQ